MTEAGAQQIDGPSPTLDSTLGPMPGPARPAAATADPPPPRGHVVHRSVSGDAYATLRQRPTPRAERHALGKAMRHDVPRSALGEWAAS